MTRKVKGSDPRDGRSTRWSAHREARRDELVLAAVAAIDAHGPQAGVGEIAAAAGVSKPVLYRYFADKADLHAAVGTWGAGVVMERLLPALLSEGTVRERVDLGCEAYLAAIEEHPNVFLLLVAHRVESDADPLADGKAAIAAAMARVLGDTLRELGVDAAGAEPWAHGLVGLGLSTGEWWLTRRTMSRAAVRGYLAAFVWHAFEGLAREYGVDLTDSAPDDPDDPDRADERGGTP
ncbi:TetR/AcrR family transcriptional regulator [Nocardioides iriomotensis]|uniref:TetR/AcrR family transcriptional regulator n=1 Tax=Nocardioides iriomotensis TaxID=715784 RepID=UPI0013ED67D6|nr:TetR/AcrR family transcriptional regulator [Nocardioides iriomotensis]